MRVRDELLDALAARQVSGMGRASGGVADQGWRQGCGIPSTSPRAITRRPGGEAARGRLRSRRGLPRVAAWSGDARSTGCRTSPVVVSKRIGGKRCALISRPPVSD